MEDDKLELADGKIIADAKSYSGFDSSFLLLIPFGIAIIIYSVVSFQRKHKKFSSPFEIRGDRMHMLSLIPTSYVINDIHYINFSQYYHYRGGFSGRMQVFLKNGRKGRKFVFTKYLASDTETESKDFILQQMEILRKLGIDCRFIN